MSEKHTKQDPGIPGETHTVDEHTLRLLGLATSITRPRAVWLPTSERELIPFAATFIAAGQAYRMTFPAVFNAPVPFSIIGLAAMYDRLMEAIAAQERLISAQRATTGFKNGVLFGVGEGGPTMGGYPPLAAPRSVTGGFVPPTDAVHTGIVPCMIAMADLLVTQPGYEPDTIGRRFGIVPTPAPSEDPATLNPNATARFTGGEVVLNFRSPRGIHGVVFAEVRCDRGDGHIHPVGMTVTGRFTDHHELPANAARANWTYYVRYVDTAGRTVGNESVTDVTVWGIA